MEYVGDLVDLEKFKGYMGGCKVEGVGLRRNWRVFKVVRGWGEKKVLGLKEEG